MNDTCDLQSGFMGDTCRTCSRDDFGGPDHPADCPKSAQPLPTRACITGFVIASVNILRKNAREAEAAKDTETANACRGAANALANAGCVLFGIHMSEYDPEKEVIASFAVSIEDFGKPGGTVFISKAIADRMPTLGLDTKALISSKAGEENMTNQFKLGQRLKDKVSGFSGIATARVEFMNGCVRYCLQPPVSTTDPAKLPDGTYFDAEQLEYVDNGLEMDTPAPKGGDRIDPPSRNSL